MYLDGQLVKLTVNDSGTEYVMYFSYDADGTPLSVNYQGTTYYYVTNLQGDVVGILNQSGNVLVSYAYDAWGNPSDPTGSAANKLGKYNPLRYRGYVYDTETGLYYLQSRYYDPEMGRFINLDGYVSTGQGMMGNNMYSYCGDNPVSRIDSFGTCYYTANGVWAHDAWEYLGGYERKPDPGYYVGSTPGGTDVYVVPADNYPIPSESVKVRDKRDTNIDKTTGKHDPDMQIRDSYKIIDRIEQEEIIKIVHQYAEENPSEYKWNRTIDSLSIEWEAHNDINEVRSNSHCQHVDFNNQDEGVTYIEYWARAVTTQVEEWSSWK